MKHNPSRTAMAVFCMLLTLFVSACSLFERHTITTDASISKAGANTVDDDIVVPKTDLALGQVPLNTYGQTDYVVINENEPYLDLAKSYQYSFVQSGSLDSQGRATAAYARLGTDTLANGDYNNFETDLIPIGYQDVLIDDGSDLYVVRRLISYDLAAKKATETDLIASTAYMDENMVPFENMVADYIRETGNHVMYRVTPFYAGNNALPDGVEIEAVSAEDDGEGISFNVYVYNFQPGMIIDYKDGSAVSYYSIVSPEQYAYGAIANDADLSYQSADGKSPNTGAD